jgi:hypothetical protein
VKEVKNKKEEEEEILWVLDTQFADREDYVLKNTEWHNCSWQDQIHVVEKRGYCSHCLKAAVAPLTQQTQCG